MLRHFRYGWGHYRVNTVDDDDPILSDLYMEEKAVVISPISYNCKFPSSKWFPDAV